MNRIFGAAVVLVLALALVPTVFAHAKLLRSQPDAKATLMEAPKTVELWFSEELEPQFSTIVVTDQDGKHVDKNDVSLGEGNKRLQINLEDLSSGTYTVAWQALSTDQHTMKGTFTFSVSLTAPAKPLTQAAATTGQPKAVQSPGSQPKSESKEESATTWIRTSSAQPNRRRYQSATGFSA